MDIAFRIICTINLFDIFIILTNFLNDCYKYSVINTYKYVKLASGYEYWHLQLSIQSEATGKVGVLNLN